MLQNLGLTDWAATDKEDYVRIAVEKARDRAGLAQLRQTLRARMQASPLLDGAAFARDMEAAYRQMWREWCQRQSGL
jgi:protein O-GlcNAc transferase